MENDNVRLVRRFYDALAQATARGGLASLATEPEVTGLLHPDAEWHGTVGGLAEGTVARGLEAIGAAMADDSQAWEDMSFEIDELTDLGDRVLVLQRERRRGRHSGLEVETATAVLISLRDARVWRLEGYMDQEQARRAAGLEG